jgi:formamidopyrimidine-DNA glycosylase
VALNPDLRGRAPDALEVTPDYLKQVFNRKPKALVKSLLLDQEFIGGIGNAYSDEILWQARISPKSPAGSIPPEAMERLASAIPSVLLAATDHLRKNHPGMISGEFRDFLSVHNRDRSVSPTGHRIVIEKVGSKKTYYTDEQEFFGRE